MAHRRIKLTCLLLGHHLNLPPNVVRKTPICITCKRPHHHPRDTHEP